MFASIHSEQLSGAEASSSSIAPRSMHHIGDPTCSGVLLPSRNYLDSYRTSSAATTTMLPTTMTTGTVTATAMGLSTDMGQGLTLESAMTATAATSTATMTAAQANLPQSTAAAKGNPQHQQQLLQSGLKMQLQLSDPAAAASNSSAEEQLQQQQQPPSMSQILRSQLDELKRRSQPLGSDLLTHNELDLCKKHNITPTTYLSFKTVCLSGAPSLGSPMEISLRKFFIKCGWLSH